MVDFSSEYIENVLKVAMVFIGTISTTFGIGILSQWTQTDNPSIADPTFLVGLLFAFGGLTMIIGLLATFMEE